MLGRLLKPEGDERSTINLAQLAGMYAGTYSYGYSPVSVSTTTALGHAASSACIDVLSGSISTLPVDAVRNVGKIRKPVVPTPQIIVRPSVLVQNDVWFYQLADSMLTDGNGFGLVAGTDAMQRPTQLELLDPECVTEREVVKGVPQAKVDNIVHKLYPYGDLWHVPGKYIRAGTPFAESPIARAAATIGAAVAARDFGSHYLGDGGHPSGIIYSDQDLDANQASAIKARFVDAMRGSRQPAVFGSGLKYDPVSVNPQESQFLELMQFCIEEACRFWRVPPAMVYAATSGQNVTYSNVSQADLHYLKHSLEWLLVRVENAMSGLLAGPQRVRFNRNAFLRADATTRGEYMDKRLRNRTLTVNEYRALEDEEPFDDEFDEPGIPGIADDEPEEVGDAGTD